MFDTYGEDYFTIRGFVEGGWNTLRNSEGNLSSEGRLFHLSSNDFETEIIPCLTSNDLTIFPFITQSSIPIDHPLLRLALKSKKSGAKTALILIGEHLNNPAYENFDSTLKIILGKSSLIPNTPILAEFSAKLVFNAITTGACVQKGRVFCNTMINLGISNNKLFFRSIGIISRLIGVTEEVARIALLKSIYETDTLSEVTFE